MYLNLLNQKEKMVFLDLAYEAARSNGIIDIFEEKMLSLYHIELGSDFEKHNYQFKETNTEELLGQVQDSSPIVKRIIYLELLSICLSDQDFDIEEQSYMKAVAQFFSFNTTFIEEGYRWTKKMIEYGQEGLRLINGKEE